jgi:hypothetical protein
VSEGSLVVRGEDGFIVKMRTKKKLSICQKKKNELGTTMFMFD